MVSRADHRAEGVAAQAADAAQLREQPRAAALHLDFEVRGLGLGLGFGFGFGLGLGLGLA